MSINASVAPALAQKGISGVRRKVTFLLIAIAIAIAIALIPAPEGLTAISMRFMGIFIGALFLLVTNSFDDWVVFLAAISLMVLTGTTTMDKVFAPFSGSTVWMMIMVFALAAAIGASGLLTRVAFLVLTLFPASYNGALSAILTTGVVLGPLVPSTAAKVNLIIPVANELTSALGLQRRSRGAIGLFAITFMPIYIGAQAFMSGSVGVPILMGFMGPDGASFNIITWFVACSVWYVTVLFGTYIFCRTYCKPTDEQKLSKEYFKEKAKSLGPISNKEKIVSVVLAITILLWATTSLTKLNTPMIGLVAICILAGAGLLSRLDFMTKVPWSLIVFIGAALGIPAVMASTGWNSYLASALSPIVGPVMSSPWIFIPFLCVLTIVMRLFILDPITLLIIYLALFGPLMATSGMNMFILIFVTWAMSFVTFQPYMAPGWLGSIQLADKVEFADVRKAFYAYVVICFIGLMASTPLWYALGYIK